jgi:hypothetical protein
MMVKVRLKKMKMFQYFRLLKLWVVKEVVVEAEAEVEAEVEVVEAVAVVEELDLDLVLDTIFLDRFPNYVFQMIFQSRLIFFYYHFVNREFV